jgi:hypothetical protein
VKIKQTSSPSPRKRSKIRWRGVPTKAEFLHEHDLSLFKTTEEKSADRNSGTDPRAGLTLWEMMPEMRRKTNPTGKVATQMARRQ